MRSFGGWILGTPSGMHTLEYAPGRHVDVFGTPSQAPVLMWHGSQTDARSSLQTLGAELANRGLCVIVPDWDSHAIDGGRSDLLLSFLFARKHTEHPNAIVLVGWSMGGLAAAGLTLQAARRDIALAHTVCLAGAFTVVEPISGGPVTEGLASIKVGAAFTLLHGSADDVVPIGSSTAFAAELDRVGWPVETVELTADHGSIAGARYDRSADRYVAADDPDTLAVVTEVADRIVAAARR